MPEASLFWYLTLAALGRLLKWTLIFVGVLLLRSKPHILFVFFHYKTLFILLVVILKMYQDFKGFSELWLQPPFFFCQVTSRAAEEAMIYFSGLQL